MCAYFPEFIKTIRILTPSRQEKPVMFSNFVIEKINHASMVSKIDYRRDTNVNYIFSLKFRDEIPRMR